MREFDHSELMANEFGQTTNLIAELSAYLREPKMQFVSKDCNYERLQYLDKFPLIKQLYLKYNCIFQTEADVERVFSYAGIFFLLVSNCVVHLLIKRSILICIVSFVFFIWVWDIHIFYV